MMSSNASTNRRTSFHEMYNADTVFAKPTGLCVCVFVYQRSRIFETKTGEEGPKNKVH